MTILKDITYIDWQYKLNNIGSVAEGIEDINQCIAIIITTPKGTVPHRPTFGSDVYKYVDYPIISAKPNIIRETIDAINFWEKRIKVDSVSVENNEEQLKVKVQWSLVDSDYKGNVEVRL